MREFVHADVEAVFLHRTGISMFLRSASAISGTGDGPFRRSPLVEVGVGARSFADKRLCAMWGGRAAVAWRSGEPLQNRAF